MKRSGSTSSKLALVAWFALAACGDDSGSGGSGGDPTTSSGGAGGGGASSVGGASAGGASAGGASAGGAGAGGEPGTGGGSCEPTAGNVAWVYDGNDHTTSAAQPPTVGVGRNGSIFQLTINAVDTVDSGAFNLVTSISAPANVNSIVAGTYPCALPSTLPSVVISMAEGGTNADSNQAGGACTLTLDQEVVEGGAVQGSVSGTVSNGAMTFPFEACFDLVHVP